MHLVLVIVDVFVFVLIQVDVLVLVLVQAHRSMIVLCYDLVEALIQVCVPVNPVDSVKRHCKNHIERNKKIGVNLWRTTV